MTQPSPTILLWICGYKGIPGNELVETAATTASNPPRVSVYASVRYLIRTTLIDPTPVNSQAAEVYGGFSWFKEYMVTNNRTDVVRLARPRAGHTPAAESLRQSPRLFRRPPVSPLQRGATDDRTLAA